jgi:hypothetical protein
LVSKMASIHIKEIPFIIPKQVVLLLRILFLNLFNAMKKNSASQ